MKALSPCLARAVSPLRALWFGRVGVPLWETLPGWAGAGSPPATGDGAADFGVRRGRDSQMGYLG